MPTRLGLSATVLVRRFQRRRVLPPVGLLQRLLTGPGFGGLPCAREAVRLGQRSGLWGRPVRGRWTYFGEDYEGHQHTSHVEGEQ